MKPVARDGNYFFRRVRQFVTCEITENNFGCTLLRGKLTRHTCTGEYEVNIELVAIVEIYDVCSYNKTNEMH